MSQRLSTLPRRLQLSSPVNPVTGSSAAFLWGARQTGKTTLLHERFPTARFYDLLDTTLAAELSVRPRLLREQVLAQRPETVVVDEIQHLINDFGIREIHFQDDSMSINKVRMNQICDEIIKRKLDFKWATPNGIAHWTLDKRLIRKMKKAGCYRLTFGIESGNPEMRKWLGKPYSLTQAKELTRYANKIGLWTIATNILGFPYETKDQIEDTINFAIDSDVDFALFYRLAPRWGTPVYDVFKKEGLLPKNETAIYGEGSACDTKVFTKEELVRIRNEAHQRFLKYRLRSFLNPLRIARKINSWEDFWYLARLGRSGLRMAWGFARLGTKKATSTTFRE